MNTAQRIAAVGLILFAALLQVSISWRLGFAGAAPNFLILVVSALALLTGSIPGAVFGFIGGVSLALFGAVSLGPHALLATLIGYTIGRIGEFLITDEHPTPPLITGIAATFTYVMGRPIIEFLVNPMAHDIASMWKVAFITTVMGAVFAIPVYLLVLTVLRISQGFTIFSGSESRL